MLVQINDLQMINADNIMNSYIVDLSELGESGPKPAFMVVFQTDKIENIFVYKNPSIDESNEYTSWIQKSKYDYLEYASEEFGSEAEAVIFMKRICNMENRK
jgi:hypothetical protein